MFSIVSMLAALGYAIDIDNIYNNIGLIIGFLAVGVIFAIAGLVVECMQLKKHKAAKLPKNPKSSKSTKRTKGKRSRKSKRKRSKNKRPNKNK